MNYIDIKEAVKATGKSEKTIRRFLSKAESEPYIDKKLNKIFVDVNYLFSSYPPVKPPIKTSSQKVSTVQVSMYEELTDLKVKLALFEQEIKHKDQLLREKELHINEKDERITDLQKAILLLEAPKEQEQPVQKKKSWWKF